MDPRRTRAAVMLVIVAIAAFAPAARAADPIGPGPVRPVAHGTALSSNHPVLGFSGTFRNPTPLPSIGDPDPTVCVPQWCQQWRLAVATTKPFLASIRNAKASIDDGLNLYVYDPNGDQIGSSAGVGSDGQAVEVSHPTKGNYRLVVTVTYQYDPTAKYLGEARIMADLSWDVPRCGGNPPCPMLPRLRPLPPSDLHVDGIPPVASTPLGFPFPFTIPTHNSCYLDETASSGATRCLRFTSEVDNVGDGLLRLRLPWIGSNGRSGFVPGECRADQIVEWTDGKTTGHRAGPCEFHAEHGHFHYDAFVSFGLYRVRPDGTIGGLVGRSLKESFCLADDGYFGFASKGPNGPRRYAGQPDCNVPSDTGARGAFVNMGLTPGWGDIYTWDTPSQYIDISNLPAGIYDLVSETNPHGLLRVAGPARVCASTRIRITASKAKVLGKSPEVACP